MIKREYRIAPSGNAWKIERRILYTSENGAFSTETDWTWKDFRLTRWGARRCVKRLQRADRRYQEDRERRKRVEASRQHLVEYFT